VEAGQSVARTLAWVGYTRGEQAAGRGAYFVVECAGALAGACDIRLPDREDPRIGEVGYLLAAAFRGRGVMTRALRLMVSWGLLGPLRLERVQALTHPSNAASAALLARLGFVREGLLRAYRAGGGGAREDRVIWSVLPIDWPAQ
jgi:RimJ/RimL family protein N-acetyltransferase